MKFAKYERQDIGPRLMENKYLCLFLLNNRSSFLHLCTAGLCTENVLQSVKLPHGAVEQVKNILWMWSSSLTVHLLSWTLLS